MSAHLVGSMNVRDHESAFRLAAEELGGPLKRIPDGEVGRPFTTWYLPVILGHPAVEEAGERLIPVLLRIRVRPGALLRARFVRDQERDL